MLTLSNTPMIFATASVRHTSSTASYASHALATTTYCELMLVMMTSAGGNASFTYSSGLAGTPTAPFARNTFSTTACSSCRSDSTVSFRMRVWMM